MTVKTDVYVSTEDIIAELLENYTVEGILDLIEKETSTEEVVHGYDTWNEPEEEEPDDDEGYDWNKVDEAVHQDQLRRHS